MCTHTRTRTLCRQTTGNVNKITVSVHCTYINRKSRKYLRTHTHTLILRWTAFYTKCIALQTQNKNFITYCVATIIIIEADCWFLSRVTKLLFFLQLQKRDTIETFTNTLWFKVHKNHNNYCIAYIFIVWTGASNYNLKSFESKQMSLNKMNQ